LKNENENKKQNRKRKTKNEKRKTEKLIKTGPETQNRLEPVENLIGMF
jgi:hypothetical protein